MHISLLALLGLALVGIPNFATASKGQHREVKCDTDRRMVNFKKVFGSKYVAFLQFRRVGDDCVKVLSGQSNLDDSFVTQDCQKCQRSHGGDDKSWRCEKLPKEEVPKEKKHSCQMALGPDCKWYLVNKDDDNKPCV